MNPDRFSPDPTHQVVVDQWELQTCQQAFQWHAMAQALCQRQGRDCLFYLGNVGSGRIESDILNRSTGHISRDDLALAMELNALEIEMKRKTGPG